MCHHIYHSPWYISIHFSPITAKAPFTSTILKHFLRSSQIHIRKAALKIYDWQNSTTKIRQIYEMQELNQARETAINFLFNLQVLHSPSLERDS